jgi:hypothetical protein
MMHILFQINKDRRARFIAGHKFYVGQAATRLLSQFQNIESEADSFAEEWLNSVGHNFDPDRHDPASFYEQANDERIYFYLSLSEMQERTRLSVVAGIFHEWDKQLRSWLIGEINHWHRGDNINKEIWKVNFEQVKDLLEAFGYDIKTQGYYHSLNRCRLVVNAYKHGHGNAFEAIKKQYPEFVETFGATDSMYLKYADHDALRANESHIEEFSNAIVEFWNSIPEDVYKEKLADFPKWFQKAFNKDIEIDAQKSSQ